MIKNGRIVVVNFPAGGAGKFLQNCLALSRHCCVKDLKIPVGSSYQTKLVRVLATVPPPGDMKYWLRYELNDSDYYGRVFNHSILTGFYATDFPQPIQDAAAAGLWVTYSAHNHGGAVYPHFFWPSVRYVCTWPCKDFVASWAHIKNHNTGPSVDWDNWDRTPDGQGFMFDIDNTIYHADLFLAQMSELYTWMGWTDFEQAKPYMSEYHAAYIAIHQ